ncbi:pilus assembly PilX family protein [Sandaracinus amylolyticus]|uniref:Type 4 fimbrial biogenesis protein PilX N-terminal domain-containing protein n=1 Tax=Sandaracinus amylolyticus TaxID=927083 RepID=A0A0F6VZA0_9BACT|nr:hypothetical protein [Sandaracinus amylolyticus]AKF03265.1 hypothetical protein DB32_000414 [Sandaracinus amylolyticus]
MTTRKKKRALLGASRTKRRDGAAMLVVMALLLIVTATATLAIHSTSVELRGTGNARQRMQTRYVAEGALVSAMTMIEQSGPEPLSLSLERSQTRTGSTRRLAPEEPVMDPMVGNHRIEMTELVAPYVANEPIASDSLGHGLGYVPNFVVDVNDSYRFTGIIAGHRSDGMGTLEYVAATYTARGRTQLPGRVDAYSPGAGVGTSAPDERNWTVRGHHESAMNSRAIGISGPTRRR